MGSVGAGFSMSLDGFIAGPDNDTTRLFQWYFMGDTDVDVSIGDQKMTLKVSPETAELYQETRPIGAIVSGRGMFDIAGAWGGKHPMDVPVFVVTHRVPQEWVGTEAPFTFVTNGVASAIEQAKAVAGDKSVGVGGANITQQCLREGLLDEIGIDLIPVLLGKGVRLFEQLSNAPIELELTSVRTAPGVTHLRYRVVK